MKKLLSICAVLLFVLGVVRISDASPINFSDTTTFLDTEPYTDPPEDLVSYGGARADKLEGPWDYVRWTHHFEFDPPAQEVLSGTLTVWLADDCWDPCWLPFEFAVGWAEDGTFAFGEVDTDAYSYAVKASFLEDGEFTVTLVDLFGDFYIKESVLSGTYSPVPIPSSMLLLASGLACLLGVRKKKLPAFKKSE